MGLWIRNLSVLAVSFSPRIPSLLPAVSPSLDLLQSPCEPHPYTRAGDSCPPSLATPFFSVPKNPFEIPLKRLLWQIQSIPQPKSVSPYQPFQHLVRSSWD